MNQIHQDWPFGSIWKLFQVLCLCVLLLPALAAGEELEPTGEPVPVQANNSGNSKGQTAGTDEQVVREIQSALNSADMDNEGNLALLIPILGVTFIFGGPVLVVVVIAALYYRFKTRRAQIQAEAALKALETGRELPPELLENKPMERAEDNLRKGVKNIGLGLGLVLGLSFLTGFEIGALGFILVGIGGAQLALWKLDDRKRNETV